MPTPTPSTEEVRLAHCRASEADAVSARLDPELLRQVKIAVATRGTTLQAATAEAFELWLDQKHA